MRNNQRKRILWLTNLPAPYRFPIWEQLAGHFDVSVAFLLKPKNWRNWTGPKNQIWESQFLGLNSVRIGEYDLIPSFRGIKKLIHNIDIAIIGGWESPMYIAAILLAKRRKIPIIQFYESFSDSHRFKRGLIARFRKWILSKPDKYITISSKSTSALISLGVNPSEILTLFNCVDGELFNLSAKKYFSPKTSGHKYIYVGQLIERKNLQNVIRAFSTIMKNQDKLTIVGSGLLESELKQLVNLSGINEKVHFAGYLKEEELTPLLCMSDTLVLASTVEVWGLVVNEALASGLHVVVSENCGVTELVKDMQGVYICKTDVGSIAKELMKSRNEHNGLIQNPEILKYSPKLFVDRLIKFLPL